MSKGEIIPTILAFIMGSWVMIKFYIPMLLEWLDAVSIDETTIGKEDENGQADNQ